MDTFDPMLELYFLQYFLQVSMHCFFIGFNLSYTDNNRKETWCSFFLGAKYKRHASVTMPLLRRGKISKHFDLIIDCTEKLLLDKWRSAKKDHVHCDILQQCQYFLMTLFGHIAFNYDLDTPTGNVLTQALHEYLSVFKTTLYLPRIMGKIYLKFSSRYRRAILTSNVHRCPIHFTLDCGRRKYFWDDSFDQTQTYMHAYNLFFA